MCCIFCTPPHPTPLFSAPLNSTPLHERGEAKFSSHFFQTFVGVGHDGHPWRAAWMNFWNTQHCFLAPIVSKVRAGRESGSWTAGRDRLLGWTFETNGTDSYDPLFQKSIRAGRGGGTWTDSRCGLLGWTFETNGTSSLCRLFQKSVRACHGSRPSGLLGRNLEANGFTLSIKNREWIVSRLETWLLKLYSCMTMTIYSGVVGKHPGIHDDYWKLDHCNRETEWVTDSLITTRPFTKKVNK